LSGSVNVIGHLIFWLVDGKSYFMWQDFLYIAYLLTIHDNRVSS